MRRTVGIGFLIRVTMGLNKVIKVEYYDMLCFWIKKVSLSLDHGVFNVKSFKVIESWEDKILGIIS